MTTRVLIRDIKDADGNVKWAAGRTLDFSPTVWAGICDSLGLTLGDISVPSADDVLGAMQFQALEKENAELKAAYLELTGADWDKAKALAAKLAQEEAEAAAAVAAAEAEAEAELKPKKGKGK